MPQWIHDRADHIRSKNPGMPESEAFAIATQQAHASGKSPKGYGTAAGRRDANKKYDKPASKYEKKADPKTKKASVEGFVDELEKIAFGAAGVADVTKLTKPNVSMAKPKPISVPRESPPPAPVTNLSTSSNAVLS